MTFAQAVEYVNGLANYERKLPHAYDKQVYGTDRIRRLLDALGAPETQFRSIHVAGTNGKGSVCAMAESVLRNGGWRTGLFTSPHLCDMRERCRVSGCMATESEFAALVASVRDAVESLSDGELVTFFEVYTALGFLHFAGCGVDVALVEVGLGGRLDSTNVLTPDVCVITSIGRDHTQYLGDTLAAIAAEKAGIIKPHTPVVTIAEGEALEVIRAEAKGEGCPLHVYGENYAAQPMAAGGWRLRLGSRMANGSADRLVDVPRPSLRGAFQGRNAACAVMAAILFVGDDVLPDDAIRHGLAETQWPGRFQVIEGRPTIVLDGAMNPEGAVALREAIEGEFPGRSIVIVLGVSADKRPDDIADALIPGLARDVIATAAETARALPADALRRVLTCRPWGSGEGARVHVAEGCTEALHLAQDLAGPNGVVCVTGSLYLVGEALSALGLAPRENRGQPPISAQ